MNVRLTGGIMLIVGTCIGGGMLALPTAAATEGFLTASALLIGSWVVMTIGAFLILEVNLWLPDKSNMVSMARVTLGRWGQIVAWLTYLLLLYALLAAYISTGADILQSLLADISINLPEWVSAILVVLFLGSVVWFGIQSVDMVNRGFLSTKLVAYILLVIAIVPHVTVNQLLHANHVIYISTVTVMITSFGFATIVPSLRTYFDGNMQKLRLAILIGSLIPLVCYVIWIAVVQGVITDQQLIPMATSGHSTSDLVAALDATLQRPWIDLVVTIFTSVAAATSFMGVALCLTDFLADGLKKEKVGHGRALVNALTFAPPLLIVLIAPGIFVQALSYAGIFCLILLALMPALMAWRGRYHHGALVTADGYQVWGGRVLVALQVVVVAILIVWSVIEKLH